MRHIISVLLENESGALSRVAGLFSARSFNIESLSVAPSEDPSASRMTIVTSGDDNVIEQIVKQLDKLLDVIEVSEITSNEHIEREIAFVKKVIMKDLTKKSILKLKQSSTLVINEKCKELINQGKKVYQFGFGQSPFPVPDKIVSELKKMLTEKSIYQSRVLVI